MTLHLPKKVRIVEVGPRDGLQNESGQIPTESKIEFVDALSESGVAEIEVTAFVHPARVPQLADATDVLRGIKRRPGLVYSALVPNEKGLERALDAGIDRASVFTAASETFNQKNINASIEDSVERFRPVAKRLRAERIGMRGYISTAFVCPYEGEIASGATVEVVKRLLDLGTEEISIGDTIGAAVPSHIDRLLDDLAGVIEIEKIAMHFHDTRGTALPNVLLSLQRGVTIFDASAGGLGGCPYAPGASGNLSTEDLCYFLAGLGVDSGVNMDALALASDVVERVHGRPLPSRVRRAGPLRT